MTTKTDSEKKPRRQTYAEQFAEEVISRLKDGTAPWVKPWKPGEFIPPSNPVSGTVYRGSNLVALSMKGHKDPRWVTLKQANDQGWKIKKGSRGTPVVYWQFSESIPKLDEQGNPVRDAEGTLVKETKQLNRPMFRGTHVFNAAQIEGMPPLDLSSAELPWQPLDKAEEILSKSGATISHDQLDRACYRQETDEILLPPRENFETPDRYYATALHELGHWTGHKSRLARDLSNPFGSEGYAKEELRAEIGSWMTGMETGVGHDPGQHASYVASWVKAIKEDPYEIIRACRDAEKIKEYVMDLGREKVQQQKMVITQEINENTNREPEHSVFQEPALATEKTYLNVPYTERNSAKTSGAKWDKDAKLWFAPEGTDLNPLREWLPEKTPVPAKTMSPQEEFARHLAEAGLDLRGTLPEMDGTLQRVPAIGGKPGNLDGTYAGFLDGIPAGWCQNHRTGEKSKWIATGHMLTGEQKQTLTAEQTQRKLQQEKERKEQQERVAQKCAEKYTLLSPAPNDHPYFIKKGIAAPKEIKVDIADRSKIPDNIGQVLVVPLINTEGSVRTFQAINESGQKIFAKGGEKKGNFFLIGADLKKDEKSLQHGEIFIAEGVATGVSINEATGKPVAVAFDSGNLEHVAVKLKEKYPAMQITICADNDHAHTLPDGKPYNLGVDKAQKAADRVAGKVIVPQLTKEEKGKNLTDFNDVHKSRGLDAVKQQFGHSLRRSPREQGHERGLEL